MVTSGLPDTEKCFICGGDGEQDGDRERGGGKHRPDLMTDNKNDESVL